MSDRLVIRNMVCARCVDAVRDVFEQQELPLARLDLGLAELSGGDSLSETKYAELRAALSAAGFELIDDRRAQLIEKIRRRVLQLVRGEFEGARPRLSEYLEQNLHYEFGYLSSLFVAVEGMTLEQHWLRQRVERVKELLVYDELSLAEIAREVGYSSPAHLSAQFKQITGMPPGRFRKERAAALRLPLDQV